jgi:DNA-binding Lrp family transcriptional regulator
MEPGNAPHKTVKQRLLEILAANSRRYNEWSSPYIMTQDGLAEEIGISRAHVSLELKKLEKEGLVDRRYAHVKHSTDGLSRTRRRVYVITHPREEAEHKAVQALGDYAFQTLGRRGCRELSVLLEERANGGP